MGTSGGDQKAEFGGTSVCSQDDGMCDGNGSMGQAAVTQQYRSTSLGLSHAATATATATDDLCIDEPGSLRCNV